MEEALPAAELRRSLAENGVTMVALTWVDNSGIARVKAVPADRIAHAAERGVGASPCFDAYSFADELIDGEYSPGVVGDLRLHPDLDRLVPLAFEPGWAWAPSDRYTIDGEPHPGDQRAIAAKAVRALTARGLSALMAFECEWALGAADAPNDEFVPVTTGPAYGFAKLTERAGYLAEIVSCLGRQGIAVDQVHPEYAPGQFEVSVRAADPVRAADDCVLVRETIRAISRRHGCRASFAPKVVPDGVGNGGHVHLSISDGDANLFESWPNPVAEGFTAGVLDHLPALLAVGAPSVSSYLRLVPRRWAGAYRCWGTENREAALRLVTGHSANLEVKCFDQTANPYLLVAALVFAGLDGIGRNRKLPAPIEVDPASLGDAVEPLPVDLDSATDAFARDTVLTEAFGVPLATMLTDLRRAESARFAHASPQEILAAQRWVH